MSALSASAELVDIFRRRMKNSTDVLARSLSPSLLRDVTGTASISQLMLAILRSAPAVDPEDLHAAERLARTADFKVDLVKRAGGGLTPEAVRKLMEHRAVQAVYKAIEGRRMLAVDDNSRKIIPAFQFDGSNLLPGMAAVLRATPTTNPWALLQFMVEGDEGLGDERPIDMIRGDKKTVDRLVRFASTLED